MCTGAGQMALLWVCVVCRVCAVEGKSLQFVEHELYT